MTHKYSGGLFGYLRDNPDNLDVSDDLSKDFLRDIFQGTPKVGGTAFNCQDGCWYVFDGENWKKEE